MRDILGWFLIQFGIMLRYKLRRCADDNLQIVVHWTDRIYAEQLINDLKLKGWRVVKSPSPLSDCGD